jgi:hypothetical protein
MKRNFLSCLSIFSFALLYSQNPTFQWSKQIGDVDWEMGYAVATDANGNVYYCGDFSSTVDFDPGPGTNTLTSAGNEDGFIAKFDANGNLVWARQVGDTGTDESFQVKVDPLGNVFLLGNFEGVLDLDPGPGVQTVTANGYYDAYVIKLDPSGNLIWAKHFGASIEFYQFSIDWDSNGNLYTTGTFQGTGDFDPGAGTYTMTAAGYYDIFVQKLDATGNFIWAKQIGAAGFDVAYSLAVDANGNSYSTGYFSNTVDFEPGPGFTNLSSVGDLDIYILKLDMNGNFVWAKSTGGINADRAFSIDLDASSNSYITGFFAATSDFDPGLGVVPVSSNGGSDIFILKLDASGNYVWVKTIGSTGDDSGNTVTLDPQGNIYTVGTFSGPADFDPGAGVFNLPCAGATDAFLLKLNSAGNFTWAGQIGGSISNDEGRGIALDPSFNIFVSGSFDDQCDLDPGVPLANMTSAGSNDAFLLKLDQCITATDPVNTTNTLNLNVCAGSSTTLNASGSGTLTWYSTPTSTLSLGNGTNFVTPTLSAGTYTYYVGAMLCNPSPGRTAITISVAVCVGMNTNGIEKLSVSVFPNPFNTEINLQTSASCNIQLFDLTGKLIYGESKGIGNKKIDLSPFPSGIYFLKLNSEKDIQSIRLIKE